MTGEQIGISVSELNGMIAEAIRRDPRTRSVTVRGEVSGFRHHIASGHWYFSLKDELSSVSCVMFRTNTLKAALRPTDGTKVIVTGYIDVYPRNGSYQLYAMTLRADGIGDLFLRFEELKRKLNAEGLFDPSRKKPLPMVPRKVAVVTSESGAAIHDILNVSGNRHPSIPIVLIPVTVQGTGAGEEIARSIRKAWQVPGVDVMIVGRGGGSAEDLWCFNEEAVARAVAASPIPVVSGVGHEIDTTICDYAADVRASTPSNAAEIVFPDRQELHNRLQALELRLNQTLNGEIRKRELRIGRLRERMNLMSPEKRIQRLTARSESLRKQMEQAMTLRMERAGNVTRQMEERLETVVRRRADGAESRLRQLRERLEAISPLAVLNRGYAMTMTRDGHVIASAAEADRHRKMTLRFTDGQVAVIREDTDRNE